MALAERRAKSVGRETMPDRRTLIAYVHWGRCLANCPHCETPNVLDPAWPFMACFGAGCYRTFTEILWPDDLQAIGEALQVRPQQKQNWGCRRGKTRNPLERADTVEEILETNEQRLPDMKLTRAPLDAAEGAVDDARLG